jgi:hypothetical protein
MVGSAVLVNSWLMRWRAMQRSGSGVRRAKTAISISPFDKPKKDRVAVKAIGDEVMKVFRVPCLNFSAFS